MKAMIIVWCALLAAAALAATQESKPAAILAADFEADPPTGFAQRLERHNLLEIVEGEGVGGSRALRATYVGSDVGSDRIVVRERLGERGLEYTLCYDVKFEEDFQFVRGGKLHGLGPDAPITGGNPMRPEGWSARAVFGRDGALSTYLYCQDKSGRYGQSVRAEGFQFAKGRYQAVSIHVRLNEPPEADNGFTHIYVDGKLAARHDDVQFRGLGGDGTLVSSVLFSTFHGGNGPEWAPRDAEGNLATVHACFDNFAVHRGKAVRMAPGLDAE